MTLHIVYPSTPCRKQPTVTIDELPSSYDELMRQAKAYYKGEVTRGGLLAFIRHEFTNYDLLAAGFSGDYASYLALKDRINHRIAERLEHQYGR